MSNTKIDFSGLTAAIPEVVTDMKDLVKKKVFNEGNFGNLLTVTGGIDHDKKVGYLGEMGDIGEKANPSGCTLNTRVVTLPITEETWEPKPFDQRLFFCADDLNNTIGQKVLDKGIDKYDMQQTEYFKLLLDYISNQIQKMNWRFAWMCILDGTNVDDSPPGEFTAGVDKNLLNVQNSLFKRAYDVIGNEAGQRVEIDANNQSTYQEQLDELTGEKAFEIAQKIYFDAPLEIRQHVLEGNVKALCTLSFHDKLSQYMQGKDLETTFANLQDGTRIVKVNGVEYVAVPEWDYMINRFNNTGTKWKDPHRVLLTTKDNMLFGIPSTTVWNNWEMWYEKKDKGVYLDISDKFDTRFAHKNMLMFGV